MSEFRTKIDLPKSENSITYNNKLFLIGSCFTQNVGNKLKVLKFPVIVNPFGVLYNPVSIANSLEFLIVNKKFNKEDLNFFNHKWFSFYHHTSFSHADEGICLKQINDEMINSSEFLKNTDFLFITFGTARVYEYKKTKQIVSNCHKIPANEFDHKLLSTNQIVEIYERLIKRLTEINKNIKIVFTVSPIRHWKDGATGNLISKSILIVSIHQLLEKFKNISYFPAYEIMMDDLRDYRFYEADMIHLNDVAVEYIWKIFSDTYMPDTTLQTIKDLEKLLEAIRHKPIDRESTQFKIFVNKNIEKIINLQKKYPFLNFKSELEYFNNLISK